MNKTIFILTISILLFSYSLNAEEEKMVRTSHDKVIKIEVLNERLNGLEKQTNIQLKALEKYLYSFFVIAGVFFALISFLGYKTIANWIRSTIEDKTDDEIKKHVTLEYVKGIISKNITAELISGIVIENSKDAIDDAVNETVFNLETKAKEALSKLDNRLAKFESLERDYTDTLRSLKKETIDTSKEVTKETTKKLEQFEQKIAQVKTEENYSFDDWYFKGVLEYEKKEYKNAIKSLNKAIVLDPKYIDTYIYLGNAYNLQKKNKKAIEEYNKAIELNHDFFIAYYNRGKAYSDLKQYEEAIKDYNKVIELKPEYPNATLNISELKIITGNYESALDSITNGLSLQLEIGGKSVILYLECIATKLLKMDTAKCEAAFNEILKKDFTYLWIFEEIESWLKDANIEEGTKGFINEKTELLKKHLEKTL